MKKTILEFLKRGLFAAAGGPVVLAIVYGILGHTGVIEVLTATEVTTWILSVTLMAFIAGGITSVYTTERLPLICAILLHALVLYLDYLLMYLLNSWIPRNAAAIGIFTMIFVSGFALIWLGVYLFIKAKTNRINEKLSTN